MTTAIAADAVEVKLVEQEHRRIREGLANLEQALGDAHLLARPDAIAAAVRALAWLRRDVLPHAAWEEAWLYPQLDSIAGTPWATRAMRFEHEQIREVATLLERDFGAAEARWSNEQAFRLVIAMARLATLLSAHLAQEQWFVGPLLDHTAAER
ncbi:MAG TPA: hemerythrin domain-containing protein [Candidatus Limnocylindrales bacterium]|nr:hemerythrin domain-containing protein [Candidatus Limnocylindrales bacterium]